MNPAEFYRNLEESLDLEPGTLKGGEVLTKLGAWDSMSVVGFIAMADEKYRATIPPNRIPESPTVEDLAGLVQEFRT
jgi:acyl carrier protein